MKSLLKWFLGVILAIAVSIVIFILVLPPNEFKTEKVRSVIQEIGPEKFRVEALQMRGFENQNRQIEAKTWSKLVRKLRPRFVEVQSEGIFICLEDMGVSQSGVFVPFAEIFKDEDEAEPFYEKEFEGIWFYFSPG